MKNYELEYEVAMHQKKLLKESEMTNLPRFKPLIKRMVKRLVLTISDSLIWIGIYLQNRYQPSVETTVKEF